MDEMVKELTSEGTYVAVESLDITVLMGGPSSEREVSLISGQAVAEALARRGHRVTTADISPEDVSALAREDMEAAFIALHGRFGEDGEVQKLCEDRGVTYVGSGPMASKLAMDKDASKRMFRQAGLTTPDWVLIEADMPPGQLECLPTKIPLPCVLKPVDGGSSVDVTIARDEATRDQTLANLLTAYGRAMIETFVSGREMTVGILDEEPLPLVEIVPAQEFYDYYAKYEDEGTEYIVAPDVPAAVVEQLQADALKAHQILGCRDFSRVDFLLTAGGEAQLLEVNTIPGFTSHSLLPKSAAAVGIGFDELCDRLVTLAMKRAGE